ncbi:conserved hypothetical protein [Porphyromonas gingivalis ATCC 33277]|uniref:Uncharacterized protein n=1 Tax=Porphyromonas gingivalis (strain ATCC 33277 / DSM 20709 / CIP 103683 / JCM 12257 / NCTC 11834 / 2561) TaxID=431947 RepID=B2RKV1_PORG3|nr:conserved hypothetical protein [Porphyromonas gingivalis ATCC 33277]
MSPVWRPLHNKQAFYPFILLCVGRFVLCVYGMINDTKRWYDKENHPTRRGLIQGRHVNESIRESTECIFDPSRYAYIRGYYGLT